MALSTPLRPAALPPRLSAATPGYFSYTPRQTATAGGAAGAVASPRAGGVRLLWRGALKLAAEDGVVLDGLAFVSHLAFPGSRPASSAGSAHGTPPAVNPFSPSLSLSQGLPTTSALPSQDPDLGISLALESLRGRGEVHFRGRVRIGRSGGPGAASGDAAGASEVQGSVEGNGGVRLYVDPTCPALYAFLHRQLLPPALLAQASSTDAAESAIDERGWSIMGIVVTLGDETIDQAPLVIYALVAGPEDDRALSLHVGVYHPTPSAAASSSAKAMPDVDARAPSSTLLPTSAPASAVWATSSSTGGAKPARPDDPAPRRVPELKDVLARGKKGRREGDAAADDAPGTGEPGGPSSSSTSAVRVPKKERNVDEDDVFSMPPPPVPSASVASSSTALTARPKRVGNDDSDDDAMDGLLDEDGGSGGASCGGGGGGVFSLRDDLVLPPPPVTVGARKKSPFEADNKTTIKRVAMQSLAERGLAKTDAAFKDVWNMVSRGALFAFRNDLAARVLPMREILHIVETHLDLYVRPSAAGQG